MWPVALGHSAGVPLGHLPGAQDAASARAVSSATVIDPAARRSRAKEFAVRRSTSLTGVGTPCSRPSRTISPLR